MKEVEFKSDYVGAYLSYLRSGFVVDHASIQIFAEALVSCRFDKVAIPPFQLLDYFEALNRPEYYYQFSYLWSLWRFGDDGRLLDALASLDSAFHNDYFLGRLTGGLAPRFLKSPYEREFRNLPAIRRNEAAQHVISFISQICSLSYLPPRLSAILFKNNDSNRNGITPQKFNLVLALAKHGNFRHIERLIEIHNHALTDIYYQTVWIGSGLSLNITDEEVIPKEESLTNIDTKRQAIPRAASSAGRVVRRQFSRRQSRQSLQGH